MTAAQMRRQIGRAIDSLRRRNEISRFRLIDAGHELLRIAVDHRKPGRLNLHHDAMALQKDMIVIAQRDVPFRRLVRQ